MAELNLQNQTLDENNPYRFMNSIAWINACVREATTDVILRFGDRYVSPGLALIIRALSDELAESPTKNRRLRFKGADYLDHPEMQQFFHESGLVQSIDRVSQQYLDRISSTKKSGSKKANETPRAQIVAPHKIDLIELKNLSKVEQKVKLVSEVNSIFSLLKEAYPDADFDSMISMLIELFSNALFHSYSKKAYSMAVRMRDGGYFIGIYDLGIGIPGAYERYRNNNEDKVGLSHKTDGEAIAWAMEEGHSTLQVTEDYPRGAGFSRIKDFIREYGGKILIASNKGYYCFESGKEEIAAELSWKIKGTLFMMFLQHRE